MMLSPLNPPPSQARDGSSYTIGTLPEATAATPIVINWVMTVD